MPNYLYIAASIDGFIADKNGGIDWLTQIPNTGKSDYGFSEFMKKIDGIIMGRKTFEKVLSFNEWVYVHHRSSDD
jgi:dihydrofolate reductase